VLLDDYYETELAQASLAHGRMDSYVNAARCFAAARIYQTVLAAVFKACICCLPVPLTVMGASTGGSATYTLAMAASSTEACAIAA
jgi:hypothetical protein